MIQRLMILHLNIHEWSFPTRDSTTTTTVAGEEEKDGTPSSYSSSDEQSRLPQHHHHPYNAENASIEELQIPILYYYDKDENDDENNRSSTATGGSHQSIVHRIQFAGLCQALYQLPTTIHTILSSNTTASTTTSNDEMDDSNDDIHNNKSPMNDRTKVVQYDSDTALVFVPLTTTTTTTTHHHHHHHHHLRNSQYHIMNPKKHADIIAVIQICTSTPPSATTLSSSVSQSFSSSTPHAMEQAIQRTYLQFCLLRNGTIHERLLHPTNRNTNDNHHQEDCYPGMDQLYRYYQQMQRQRQYNHKNDYNDACYMKGRALIIVLYFGINFTLFN